MIKFFSSMKAGLIFMGLISAASIVATFQPQTTIYESIWFRGLLLLLTVNLSVCTFRRLPSLFNKFSNDPNIDLKEVTFDNGIKTEDSAISEEKLYKSLKEQGYKVNKIAEDKKTYIFARKGFGDLVAPHLIHIALIVIFIGALLGSFGAKQNIGGAVGETIEVPEKLTKEHLYIRINDFKTLYDKNGDIDNWESDITVVTERFEELSRGTTKVNHPFKYANMTFYQSGYGYDHDIEIHGEKEGFFSIPGNQLYPIAGRMVRIQKAMGENFVLRIYESHTDFEVIELKEGTVVNLPNDNTLTYLGNTPYTVLRVKTDPGTPVVMAGFLIITIGSFLIWSGRYREIRIGLDHKKGLVQVNVVCKNKSIQDEIKEELNSLI